MRASKIRSARFVRWLVTGAFLAALTTTVVVAPARGESAELLLQDHPLAGSLWDTRSGEQLAEADLIAAALGAHWVLLGEKHDNAEHHRLQARIVAALGEAGRRPGVVWEMAGPDQAGAFAAAQVAEVGQLGKALSWEERGWPAWSIYQPIVEAALTHSMKLYPGNPSLEMTRAIGHGGDLSAEQQARLRWSVDYDDAQLSDLTAQLTAAHCGALPEAAMAPMAKVQRLRDAWMAASLRGADRGSGAVLIAGSQHVREDRGVPWRLGEKVFSLALVEVDRERTSAQDYPAFNKDLFDFVWFTGRVDEEDPCEKFFGKSGG